MDKKPRNCKTAFNAAVIDGDIWFEDVRQCGLNDEIAADILEDKHLKAIRIASLSANWQLTVIYTDATVIEKINVEMTLRKEKFGQKWHWYAYRRYGGILHKRYVGQSESINEARLLEVAQKLPG